MTNHKHDVSCQLDFVDKATQIAGDILQNKIFTPPLTSDQQEKGILALFRDIKRQVQYDCQPPQEQADDACTNCLIAYETCLRDHPGQAGQCYTTYESCILKNCTN